MARAIFSRRLEPAWFALSENMCIAIALRAHLGHLAILRLNNNDRTYVVACARRFTQRVPGLQALQDLHIFWWLLPALPATTTRKYGDLGETPKGHPASPNPSTA